MVGIIGRTTLENVAQLVSKSAPLLGSVLGSPLAGIGISLLSNLFNVDPHQTDKLWQALSNDPDVDSKLKQLEYEHQEALQQIAHADYQTEVEDRQNARLREMTIKDWVPTILALGFLMFYGAMQFYCVMNNNPQDDIISARFQDILIMIISYYFGSSHKEKPPT